MTIVRSKKTDTLIITSAINPVLEAPGVNITDPQLRLFQLCCCVVGWSQTEAIRTIIVCDNTLPKYDFEPLKQLADTAGKKIEFLPFQAIDVRLKTKEKVMERARSSGTSLNMAS